MLHGQWCGTGVDNFYKLMGFHLWAGFPCTDLSKVKFQSLNFEGPNSSLFWEGPRVQALLEEEFGPMVQRKHALENVASMDEEAATQISDAIGSTPYLLDLAKQCQCVDHNLCGCLYSWKTPLGT